MSSTMSPDQDIVDRFPDVVDDVLIRRGVVAARRFVADAVGRFPVGVDITGGQGGARFGVRVEPIPQIPAACARRRC